jgi:hypothetical protein
MNPCLFALLAVGALVACHGEPVAPSTAQGLRLSLALSATQLPQGAPDSVAVTITNTNSYAVTLSAGGCPLLFYVTDSRGATIVPSGGGWYCIAILTRLTLEPGARQTRTFVWQTNTAASGRYNVYGSFSAEGVYLETPRASVELI